MSNKYVSDFYATKAKKEGFVARSVYKLQEIDKKFLNLNKIKNILDLGAAPGSWTQYLQKKLRPQSKIVAVDIQGLSEKIHIKTDSELSSFASVTFLQEDFTLPETINHIIALGPYDLVLSDAAPSTTGNRSLDVARSEELVEMVFEIANKCLVANGMIVTKFFQGEATQNLLSQIKKKYKKVSFFKPRAVRTSSFELYVICC